MRNNLPEFFQLFDLEPGDKFEISDGYCNPYRLTEDYQVLHCENDDCTSDELFLSLLHGNSTVKKPPKVTEKEDRILHALYDLGWRWIARDIDSSLYAFQHKPHKITDAWQGCFRDELLYLPGTPAVNGGKDFLFIKWEDEEPFSIEKYVEEQER